MHCPFCRHVDSRVVDSRTAEDGSSIRRRRQCPNCGRRFTTMEATSLTVIKRSGVSEEFSRQKVVGGVRKACQGRPVGEDDLAKLAQRVEETIRSRGIAEIDADEIGLAILDPLRELDHVAYLRFASVYQSFATLEDFEAAIESLRSEARDSGSTEGAHGARDSSGSGAGTAGAAPGSAETNPGA
ncbi:transcriptional regulator NrdR [Brevibacterium samyangense]|uniref:Transcriptional repressor NrdR n=1 Tax=Brevibacterium samyangense TaxID=366888 RepID=A0ABP5ESD3_9MICO